MKLRVARKVSYNIEDGKQYRKTTSRLANIVHIRHSDRISREFNQFLDKVPARRFAWDSLAFELKLKNIK